MQRVVHFDLKGAPPKLFYFEQVLRCIQSWGVTGVLLEWEDTFPYSGNLTHLGSESNSGGDEMYTMQEVQHILALCNEIGLEVIQLVQTMGHMEFVLKHPCHEHLREYDRSPAIICPEKKESKELVKEMVMQVLAVQPDAKYFHIGADEVCHIAHCDDCHKRVQSTYPIDLWRIYLDYIRDLVLFIRDLRPNITILMWDDMIRVMTPEVLEEYRELSAIIQLVVWNYETRDNFGFPPAMWVMYNMYFPAVWAGSAFKGANGSSQMISPVSRYVNNQVAWVNEIRIASSEVRFVGVVFTGWSRYDHFATLCELLPTSLNSLANCVKCFAVGTLENYAELHRDNTLASEEWPGRALALCVQRLALVRDGGLRLVSGDLKMTWLNDWQLNNGFLNMFQVDNIENFVHKLLVELKSQEDIATNLLALMFGPRTCSEWMQTHFETIGAGLMGVRHTIRYARRYDPKSTEYAFGRGPSTTKLVASTSEHGRSDTVSMDECAPSTVEHEPSTVEQEPSTAEHVPSTVDHVPSTIEREPSDTVSMDEYSPLTAEHELSTVEHVPPTGEHVLPTIEHVPWTVEHELSHTVSTDECALLTAEHEPTKVEHVPLPVEHVPPTVQHVPSTVEHLPLTTVLTDELAASMVGDAPSIVEYVPSATDLTNELAPLTVEDTPSTSKHMPSKVDDVP